MQSTIKAQYPDIRSTKGFTHYCFQYIHSIRVSLMVSNVDGDAKAPFREFALGDLELATDATSNGDPSNIRLVVTLTRPSHTATPTLFYS